MFTSMNFSTMVRSFAWVVATFLLSYSAQATDYEDAWKALNQNDRSTARKLFEKALNNPATAADAAIMLIKMNASDNNDAELAGLWDKAWKNLKDPYPYLYSLWFNDAVLGFYGKKNTQQLKLANRLLDDPNCPDFMKSSIQYMLGHHYLNEGEFEKMREAWGNVTQFMDWQYVGPFDNLGGSGFDKNYAPIAKPEPGERFKSERNSDIWWYAPKVNKQDGWITPSVFIPASTAIYFTQTFVSSPSATEAVLGIGFTGNVKVWLNDRLIFSEQEYRKTELDTYRVPCKLNKGVNRLLVQLGMEDESYPNFGIRLTDRTGKHLPGLTSQSTYAAYQKDTGTGLPEQIPHFAEVFFQAKLKAEPQNQVNHLLLVDALSRAGKWQEALPILEQALEIAPNSTILREERITLMQKLENRTELSKDVQFIKEKDPDCYLSLNELFFENMENEKFEEAQKLLTKMISYYGKTADTYSKQITVYGRQNKLEELVSIGNEAYRNYPENTFFCSIIHNIESMLRKDVPGALNVYSSFLKKKFDVSLAETLYEEYMEAGYNDKALRLLTQLSQAFPYATEYYDAQYNYYYGQKDYKKALQLLDILQGNQPFTSSYYANRAELMRETKKEDEALANFQKTIHYRPNDFESRRKLRELQGKPDLATYFPQYDIYELIKKSKAPVEREDYGYYYVIDEQCTILYPERCSETIFTQAYKILSEKGIETWSETSIGYNTWRQRLFVEKAEVVKANGNKVTAEQSGADFVFPNLEVGDAIYMKYRIVSYATGRMSRELWDEFHFNTFVHSDVARFCLLTPKDLRIDHRTVGMQLEPVVKDVEEFKLYAWERSDIPALKVEGLMPSLKDVGEVVFVSTIQDWQDISTWYSDLSVTQAKTDYEVRKVVSQLFPEGQQFSEVEKARKIYEYVVKNIQYSSVPFRQGAYVPQRASKVIQTKLGDCKDVSTLYATLAREVGLKSNLVLVNTRDNGENSMPLPAVEFNHCIAKVMVDGQPWYLELTDRHLPFGALPSNDIGAQALEIPYNDPAAKPRLFKLLPNNRTKDYRHQVSGVALKGRDLVISVATVNSGNAAAGLRYSYGTMTNEKQVEEIQRSISGKFANPVTVKNVRFGDFSSNADTIQYKAEYAVKNEVIEIGDLKSFKVPYFYTFLEADHFSEEKRSFAINYWDYEDKDEYLDDFTISLPEGKQFADIPKDVSLNFKGTTYAIKFEKKSAGELRVVRTIKINRDVIPAADYPAFQKFLEETLEAEAKYLAFK